MKSELSEVTGRGADVLLGLFPRVESALPAAFSTHRTDVVCALLTVLSHFATPTGSDISQWPAVKRILQDVTPIRRMLPSTPPQKAGCATRSSYCSPTAPILMPRTPTPAKLHL